MLGGPDRDGEGGGGCKQKRRRRHFANDVTEVTRQKVYNTHDSDNRGIEGARLGVGARLKNTETKNSSDTKPKAPALKEEHPSSSCGEEIRVNGGMLWHSIPMNTKPSSPISGTYEEEDMHPKHNPLRFKTSCLAEQLECADDVPLVVGAGLEHVEHGGPGLDVGLSYFVGGREGGRHVEMDAVVDWECCEGLSGADFLPRTTGRGNDDTR